jgi:anti-sigma regulatory factor (Ser/Thr protein kinase)
MRHSLFRYDDDDALVDRMAPFLEAATDGEPAVVVLERAKWQRLASALGCRSGPISFIDRDAFYTRPEAALAGYDGRLRRFLRDGARAVRVFGELPHCETTAAWDAWVCYEAILNRAFAHHPVWVVCGYDAREVPDAVMDSAFETHPEVLAGDAAPSPRFHGPEEVVSARTPTAARLTGLRRLPVNGGPRGFRGHLGAELDAAGVSEVDAENMLIAAEEVLVNAQRHGGGAVGVSVGCVGGRFVCEVTDGGSGIDDPLAGYLPPRPGHAGGAGLWVARQLTRKLEFVSSPTGHSVRLWA